MVNNLDTYLLLAALAETDETRAEYCPRGIEVQNVVCAGRERCPVAVARLVLVRGRTEVEIPDLTEEQEWGRRAARLAGCEGCEMRRSE